MDHLRDTKYTNYMKSKEPPKAKVNDAQIVLNTLSKLKEEADDKMTNVVDANILFAELKCQNIKNQIFQRERDALRSSGKIGRDTDTITKEKIKKILLEQAKREYEEHLRKVAIELNCLISRKQDLMQVLAGIERGEIPEEYYDDFMASYEAA